MLLTEQIHLEVARAMEDTLFEMEDGTLAHLEYDDITADKYFSDGAYKIWDMV